MDIVTNNKSDLKYHLLFIGSMDLDYKVFFQEKMKSYIKQYNLSIHIKPFVPFTELYKYYSAIDVCIFPKETTLSSIHAQACGCKVIMENQDSNVERVFDKEFLFEKNDLKDASNRLENLFELLAKQNFNRTISESLFERNYKMQINRILYGDSNETK